MIKTHFTLVLYNTGCIRYFDRFMQSSKYGCKASIDKNDYSDFFYVQLKFEPPHIMHAKQIQIDFLWCAASGK